MKAFHRRIGSFAAVAAISALAAAAVGSTAIAPQRDAVPSLVADRRERKRRRKGRRSGSASPSKAERHAELRDGSARRKEHLRKHKHQCDNLGNYINPVRQEKKALRAQFDLKTGRAWRRWLRKAIRGEVAL